MMHGCENCSKGGAILILVVGILFLLKDVNIFDWGISWYTAAFLIVGLGHLGMASCKSCQAVMKKKK